MTVMKKLAEFALLLVLASGCVPVRTITNGDLNEDISKYESFDFFDFSYESYDSSSFDPGRVAFLKEAIRTSLETKGFKKSNKPDFLINLGVVIQQKSQTRETDPRYDMNYVGQRNYHWEREEKVVSYYEEGALTVDFVDTDSNKLVWQGTVIGIRTSNEKKMKKRISHAVEDLFKKIIK